MRRDFQLNQGRFHRPQPNQEHNMRRFLSTIITAILVSTATNSFAAAADYRFELAGAPQSAGHGTSVVSVKLVHLPDGKPVSGAIIIQSQADMGPEGMAMMSAPIKPLPEQAGVYRFEVQNGQVWNKPGSWALTFSAKVEGEPQTVRGSVTVRLGA
jgi:hypothetical protein